MDLITNNSYGCRTLAQMYLAGQKPNTLKNYKAGIVRLLGYLRTKEVYLDVTWNALSQVDLLTAKGFYLSLLSEVSPATAAVYLSGCVGLYDVFLERKIIPENPFRNPLVAIPGKLRLPTKPTPRMPSHSVQALLLSHHTLPREKAILGCLFGGGMRRAEICNLTMYDIIARDPVTLRLLYTKSSVYRELSLPEWAGEAVVEWQAVRGVLSGPKEKSLFGLGPEGLHKVWKGMLARAQVPTHYGLHTGRCTAINRLKELGYRDQDIMDFTGHSSIEMVRRYTRIQAPLNNPGRSLHYE